MARLTVFAIVIACCALSQGPARGADASSCGYDQGAGGWYSKTDRSGPYSLDGECNASLLGAGGLPPSTAIAVQRTGGIGTTGTLVSASNGTTRRTVANTSEIACEMVTANGAPYGTGYPLLAGSSFTFDASGRTTAALYVACASPGGTVAVLSY